MTWVTRYDSPDGTLWAIVRSPQADGYHCVYGEPFYGIHAHLLDGQAYSTNVVVPLDGTKV